MRTNDATAAPGHLRSTATAIVREAADVIPMLLWTAAETALRWQERWKQRQRLMMLDDHLLKDIGVSRAEVEREAGKPFWRE